MSSYLTDMHFHRGDDYTNSLNVRTFDCGNAVMTVLLASGEAFAYPATLGQVIQLRDFLNRHIDELALKQTGSLAQRASDDPTQLASVEEVPASPVRVAESSGCGRRFQYTPTRRLSCGEQSPFGPHNVLCPDCRSAE